MCFHRSQMPVLKAAIYCRSCLFLTMHKMCVFRRNVQFSDRDLWGNIRFKFADMVFKILPQLSRQILRKVLTVLQFPTFCRSCFVIVFFTGINRLKQSSGIAMRRNFQILRKLFLQMLPMRKIDSIIGTIGNERIPTVAVVYIYLRISAIQRYFTAAALVYFVEWFEKDLHLRICAFPV